MSIPADATVPERVRALAGDAHLEPVWRNGVGGLTFRATSADGIRFIMWGTRRLETSMRGEAARLRWAAPFVRVPAVREEGRDEQHQWLVTAPCSTPTERLRMPPAWPTTGSCGTRRERAPQPVDQIASEAHPSGKPMFRSREITLAPTASTRSRSSFFACVLKVMCQLVPLR